MTVGGNESVTVEDETPRRKGRPRNSDSGQRRADIMTAALHRFANHGYADTSLSIVARDVGITQPAVYHYFPDKESLYEAVFDAALERAWSAVHARLATVPEQDRSLLDLAEAMNEGGLDIDQQDARQTNLFLTTVPVEATRHHELHHLLERRSAVQDREIRAIVLPAIREGRMSGFDDTDAAVRAIRLLMMGWALETFTQRENTRENTEVLRSILVRLESGPGAAAATPDSSS
ncbi:TetR/AcrR family transcriptional regulator [Aeromicrobium sp. Sec7.5]|uniref:TetR/AcrR family transcriptional regulator n=1 Tax=Aeromicrobium sp. Sec7.5 TaxID=3121276 RepID=UPI002FE470D0